MAGNGTARSAGVAYVDLAVGDTKGLVSAISAMVKTAADQAQQELARAFDVSGNTGSFQTIVDAAAGASSEAASSISRALTEGADSAASGISDSITSAVAAATAAATSDLTSSMGDAGRMAGEQLALDFSEATRDVQLTLFDEEHIAQATEEARVAAEELAREFNIELAREMDQSSASLGNVFSGLHFQGLSDDVQSFSNAISGGFHFAMSGIEEGVAEAGGSVASFFRTALPESYREGFRGLGDAENEAEKAFSEFGKGLAYSVGTWSLGSAIGMAITNGVSSALSAVKGAVIDFNSEMQSAQISFGTLLGSDQQATGMLSQLKSFALGTPFQFENLVEDSQHLLALGINAKDIIPDLTGLGDAVSALGGDGSTLDSVTQVFGEMQSKGQIMETQIRELQIRGIPALQILSNEYGVSTTQMAAMIKSGKVMADDALPKLIAGMEKGTKTTVAMGGEMAKQSLTFKGSMSNLKDGLTQFTAAAGKPIFDLANSITSKLAGAASGQRLQGLVAPAAAHVAGALKDVETFVGKLITDLKPAEPIIRDIANDFGKFSVSRTIFKELGPAILIVAQAIGAIGHNETAARIIASLVQGFFALKAAQSAWNIVMAITNGLMDMSLFGQIALGITLLVIGFVALYQHSKTFRDILADIGSVAQDVWSGLVAGFDYVAGVLKRAFDSGPAKGFMSWLSTQVKILRIVIAGEIGLIGSIFMWLWRNVFEPVGSGIAVAIGFIGSVVMTLWRDAISPAIDGIVAAVTFVGAIFVWLWKNVIAPVVEGISFALRLLFVIVFTILVTPFVIAFHVLEPLLKVLGQIFLITFGAIGKAVGWLWHNALEPAFEWIGGLFTGGLPKAIEDFYHSHVEPTFHLFGDIAIWLWKNVLAPVGAGIAIVFGAIGAGAVWLWKNAISPALSGIEDAAVWLWQNVLVPVGIGIIVVASAIGAAFTWLWRNAISPALDDIEAGALWLWHNALEPAFHGIADVATWLYFNVLKPVFDAIGTAAKWLYSNVLKPAFDDFVLGLQVIGTWASWLYDNAIKPAFDKVGSVISGTLKDVKSGFDTAVTGITSVWNGLIDTLKGPVNFLVNTVYTNGIEEVWNFIASKVGIPNLPDAPHFADGGVVNGPRSAGDWIPLYGTAGEGILTVDEMAALGGPAGFNQLRAMLGGGGQGSDGHFKDGGIVGSIWNGIKGVGSTIGQGVSSLESYASRVVSGGLKAVASDMLKPVLAGVSGMLPGNTVMKSLLTGIPSALINGILGFFGGQDKKATAAATAGMSGDVAGWITQAEGLTGVDSSWTAALSQIIRSESGGNPRAINLTDSNAQAGDPSRGLMQTIMSTFEAYRLPSLPDDIYNPVANIVAGIRYIISRYGSVNNVPGIKSLAHGGSYVGYATGTSSAVPGWAWVGENGPELMKMSGGESIMSHGESLKAAQRLSVPSSGYSALRHSVALSHGPSGAAQAPPIVNVYIDGEKFEGRIDVKIDRNNAQLAQLLNGGISG